MTYVLGVYPSPGHDVSVCLLRDGELAVLIEEERLTHFKHAVSSAWRDMWPVFNGAHGYFPWASISYCLDTAGIGIDDLDLIVLPAPGAPKRRYEDFIPIRDKRKILVMREPEGAQHHHCHALSAFHASSFEDAAVLIVDGDGSRNHEGFEAESGYVFASRGSEPRTLFKNRYRSPDRAGLGWAYESITALLGFVDTQSKFMGEAGKTMGLAPYGKASEMLSEPWIECDGYRVDCSRLHQWMRATGLQKLVRFDDKSRALIQNERNIPAYAKDLAYKVQDELERAMLKLATQLHKDTGSKNLCLAGGVALNSVANGLIATQGPFERIFAQPAADDGGQSLGLAYYGQAQLKGAASIKPLRHAFGGRTYPDADIAALLGRLGLTFQTFASNEELIADASAELAAGRLFGWFQGGSEFGPRALGHRSILADPRGPDTKSRLNDRVKFREPFRPFAPSVLRERMEEVFELKGESPYMLLVAPVRPEWRDRVPAITHVDGTARIQSVDREVDPLYHGLIRAFAERTGVPLVLNTSFNLRGKPIVETPRDALQSFLYTEMDTLYLGRHKVLRPANEQLKPVSMEWQFELRVGSAKTAKLIPRVVGGREREVDLTSLPGINVLKEAGAETIANLVMSCNGQKTLATLISSEVSATPSESLTQQIFLIVQALLREGVLGLKFGDDVL